MANMEIEETKKESNIDSILKLLKEELIALLLRDDLSHCDVYKIKSLFQVFCNLFHSHVPISRGDL